MLTRVHPLFPGGWQTLGLARLRAACWTLLTRRTRKRNDSLPRCRRALPPGKRRVAAGPSHRCRDTLATGDHARTRPFRRTACLPSQGSGGDRQRRADPGRHDGVRRPMPDRAPGGPLPSLPWAGPRAAHRADPPAPRPSPPPPMTLVRSSPALRCWSRAVVRPPGTPSARSSPPCCASPPSLRPHGSVLGRWTRRPCRPSRPTRTSSSSRSPPAPTGQPTSASVLGDSRSGPWPRFGRSARARRSRTARVHALGAWTAAGCPRRWSGHILDSGIAKFPKGSAALPRTDRPCRASGCPRLACAPQHHPRAGHFEADGAERLSARHHNLFGVKAGSSDQKVRMSHEHKWGRLRASRETFRTYADKARASRITPACLGRTGAMPMRDRSGPTVSLPFRDCARYASSPTYVDKVSRRGLLRTDRWMRRRRCRCQGRRHRLQPLAGPRAAAHGRRHHRRRRLRARLKPVRRARGNLSTRCGVPPGLRCLDCNGGPHVHISRRRAPDHRRPLTIAASFWPPAP